MSINIPIRPFKRICFFTGFYRFTNFTTPKSINPTTPLLMSVAKSYGSYNF